MAERQTAMERKALRWAAGGFAALAIGAVAAWELGVLNGVALWAAGRALGYEVSCGRVTGDLLDSFRCEGLTLSDARGAFFSAQKLTLDWRVLSLVRNKLALTHVSIGGARLTRLPESAPSPPDASALPGIEIAVGTLDVRHFKLAINDAPAACLSVGGKGRIGPDGFDAALMLVRCAPNNGRIAFTGAYDDRTHALRLQAQGSDNGALAAALTGVKAAGQTILSLDGSGTREAFTGKFALRAVNLGHVEATFRARGFSATHIDAIFDLASALRPGWAPEGAGTLSADLARAANGAMHFDGTLNGANARLTAAGTFRRQAGSGTVVLIIPDLAKAKAGFAGRTVATLKLSRFTLGGDGDGELTVTASNIAGRGAGIALGSSPRLDAQVHAENGSYTMSGLTLAAAAATMSGAATLAKDGAFAARLDTQRGNAAAFSALLGYPLKGGFTLHAALSGTAAAPAMIVSAKSAALMVGGSVVKAAVFTVSARKAAQWSAQLALDAETPAGTVALAADMRELKDGW
ncbi:MAG TPA: hypothetical protein VMV54_02735, partial [Acidocella sp.]|nr:hypothetical protein [Acidocella sp.]